jgi:hypothetical protein
MVRATETLRWSDLAICSVSAVRAMEQAQGVETAQAVEKVAAQACQRDEVTSVGIGGAHADQRHKHGNQRRSGQQDHARRPVDRKNTVTRISSGIIPARAHLRQIAGIVVLHIFDLFDE